MPKILNNGNALVIDELSVDKIVLMFYINDASLTEN